MSKTSRRPWPVRILLIALWVLAGLVAVILLFLALSQTNLLPPFFRTAHPVLFHASDRDGQWRQDLRYLSTQLPRLHANAFFQVAEADWRAQVARLDAQIPELSDDQITVEMLRLIASIGDGHTHAYPHRQGGFRVYPLVLRWFADGLYVVGAVPEYRQAIGARVVQIDETGVEEAYQAVIPLVARDNEAGLLDSSPQLLVTPEVLSALGIVADMERATYLLEDRAGRRFGLEVAPAEPGTDGTEYLGVSDVNPALAAEPPLYLSNRQDFYWFEYLPESQTVFFQYNQCKNMESQPFDAFAAELLAFVDGHDVQRIVVDLRYNGGGNSGIIKPFLTGLEQRPGLREKGRLFAITGRGTYSSGMWNALDVQELGGILVGEPTGGKPNAYGEVRSFRLPNSGLRVQYSTRYWHRLEGSDPPSVLPDLPAEPSMAGYLAGRDVALETILVYDADRGASPQASAMPSVTDAPVAAAPEVATPVEYWPTAGWRTSTPEEQGMDSRKLAQMLEAVEQQHLELHSLLVIRNGYLVSETYFPPYDETVLHELYSCTKSFISTLVGIAVDKGYLDDLQQPVLSFFPDRSFENVDARKEAMTVEDLLTMRSGLDWQEEDTIYAEMFRSEDWVKFVLDRPMKEPPGTRFNYCSGCSHVLSAIVQQATGMPTLDFAQKELFEPLGIPDFQWSRDRMGIASGGWGLQLTPRDMAKLGYLYLHNGAWAGRQLVPAQWVQEATQRQTDTDSELGLGYGYQWWTWQTPAAPEKYMALGRDGQTILVAPELDLVVVTTAATDGHQAIFDLIEAFIE